MAVGDFVDSPLLLYLHRPKYVYIMQTKLKTIAMNRVTTYLYHFKPIILELPDSKIRFMPE